MDAPGNSRTWASPTGRQRYHNSPRLRIIRRFQGVVKLAALTGQRSPLSLPRTAFAVPEDHLTQIWSELTDGC